jgi:phage-related protein
MKAAEAKTVASPAKKNTPSTKGSEDHFFAPDVQERSFFNHTKPIQRKLTIGRADDPYEREADAVAGKVVQKLSNGENQNGVPVQRKINGSHSESSLVLNRCASCGQEEKLQKEDTDNSTDSLQRKPIFESNAEPPDDDKNIQRKCAACEQEEKLQKKSDNSSETGTSDIEGSLKSSKGGGSPIPTDTKAEMEASFGVDFSNVRLHTDHAAVGMSNDLNAQAFTHGNDIYFNSGKYDADSQGGKHLLAHELTHTVQQGASVRRMPASPVGDPMIQREEQSVLGSIWDATGGKVVDSAADMILDQMRSLSPSLVAFLNEVRREGVIGYFKKKLMEAVNGIFDGLQNNSGVLSAIFPQFTELVARARVIVNALAAGDCKPLFAAMNELKELVTTLAGEAWDAIVEFFQPAIDFFSDLWNSFALPALEWLKQKAASVWNWIKEIGARIWEWYRPLREAVGAAWDYIKGIIGLNADETGEEGLIQWAQRKAGEVWEFIKEELRPIIEPAKAMIAKIKEIIPLSAILNLRKTIQDWLKNVVATSTGMGEDASNVGNEAAQTSLRDQILPAIQQSIENFRGSISEAAAWVNGKIGEVFTTVTQFFASVRSISILNLASGLIGWIETKINDLNTWVQSKVTALFDMVSQGLHNVGEFLQPIYDMLVRILGILGDILGKLPDFLMGPLWWILPECIKEPIRKFFLEQILGRMSFFQKLQQIENIWERLEAMAITILKQIFIDGNLKKAIWTFFSTMLDILGLPPQLVTKVIAKAAQSLSDLLDDPLGFLMHFVEALKLGFGQFFDKIGSYLLSGLQAWLFGKLEGTGIEMPKDFSFKSMLKFALEVLGITVDMLLTKLEEVTGKKGLKAKIEKVIGVVSKAFDWLEKLFAQDESGGSFWDRLENAIGNIWDFLLDAVVGWLEKTIVVKALAWVASKLDPTGIMAVITTIIDVYNVVSAIMEKAKEIFEMIDKVLDGFADLIKGVIGAAATIFEKALGAAVPVVMAILSSLFGLDDVVDEVKEAIKRLRKKVEDGVKKIMTSIKGWVEKLFGKEDDGSDSIKKALAEIEEEGKKEMDENEVTKDEAELIKNKVNKDHPSVIEISSIKDAGANWEFEYIQKKTAVINKGKLAKGKNQKALGITESGNAEPERKIVCRSGTLDARLNGAIGDVMQAHHMISCSVAKESVFALAAAESGYDINRKGNGILLPSTNAKWESLKGKKPLHRGGHTQEYYNLVEQLLNARESQARNAMKKGENWTDVKLVEAMGKVEKEMESSLMNYEVVLSNQDPSLV